MPDILTYAIGWIGMAVFVGYVLYAIRDLITGSETVSTVNPVFGPIYGVLNLSKYRGGYNMFRIIKMMLLFTVLLLAAYLQGNANMITEWVYSSSQCPWSEGIQGCINRAGKGDTVRVQSYGREENLTINKPLSLIGQGWMSTYLKGRITILDVKDQGRVLVQGFEIRDARGIVVFNSRNVLLEANYITGHEGQAVWIEGGSEVTMKNNGIISNKGDGISVIGSSLSMERNAVWKNAGCGVKTNASQISGSGNRFRENGTDLCPGTGWPSGFVSATMELKVPQDIPDLGTAIENAWPEDTIRLAGYYTYEGSWDIQKPLTIIGDSRENVVLKNLANLPVFNIYALNVGISNLTILASNPIETYWEYCTENDPTYTCTALLTIFPYGGAIVENVTVDGNDNAYAGIATTAFANISMENTTVTGTTFAAMFAGAGSTVSAKNMTVKDNAGVGIFSRFQQQLSLQSSTVIDNKSHGIYVVGEAIVDNNTISGNRGCGILGFGIEDIITQGQNTMINNLSGDLCGEVPASLRKPLASQGTKTPLTVCSSGCDHTSLQEAVDALPSGGEINLRSGTYLGGITIWKPLNLIGTDRLLVTVRGPLSIIGDISEVNVEDLTITDSPSLEPFPSFSATISSDKIGKLSLENVDIVDNDVGGIAVSDGSVYLKNVDVKNNDGIGVNASSGQELRVENTEIENNEESGIYAMSIKNVKIIGRSRISENGNAGAYVANAITVEIRDSQMNKNTMDGFVSDPIDYSQTIVITDSQFNDNTGNGIAIVYSEGIYSLSGNSISSNGGYGIYVMISNTINIQTCSGNTLLNNVKGAYSTNAEEFQQKCR